MPHKLPFQTTVKKTKHKKSEGLGRFNVGVPRGSSNLRATCMFVPWSIEILLPVFGWQGL